MVTQIKCSWLRNIAVPARFLSTMEIKGSISVTPVAGCSFKTAFWEQVTCGSSLRSRSRLVQLCVDKCCRTSSISHQHVKCHNSEDAHDRLSEGHCYLIMRYLVKTRSCSWSLKNGTSEAHMKKSVVAIVCVHVESVGEVTIGQRYISNQLVCIMRYRAKPTSRRHITERYVVLPTETCTMIGLPCRAMPN